MHIKFILCYVFSLMAGLIMAQNAPAKETLTQIKKPNVVFILMDNLGYGESGCYGGAFVRGPATPRIDMLATQGTRLLNYNVEAQCTPSRSALMTGRFSMRSGTHSISIGGGLEGLTQCKNKIVNSLV